MKELIIPTKQIRKLYNKIFEVYKSWGLKGQDYGATCQELYETYGFPNDLDKGIHPCPVVPYTASEIIKCLRYHLKRIKTY